MTVTCTRCGREWDEADPGARYAYGEWQCASEDGCDEYRFGQAQAGDHPDGF